MIALAAYVWACGLSGLCLDVQNPKIHFPTIETAARSTQGTVFPIIIDCLLSRVYYLDAGLSGDSKYMQFEDGSIFHHLCEHAFGDDT